MKHTNKKSVLKKRLLCYACHVGRIETHLQPLQGDNFAPKSTKSDDYSSLNINANARCDLGLKTTFFNVKNLNPLVKCCPESIS